MTFILNSPNLTQMRITPVIILIAEYNKSLFVFDDETYGIKGKRCSFISAAPNYSPSWKYFPISIPKMDHAVG